MHSHPWTIAACPDAEALALQAAQKWVDEIQAAASARRSHFVALSGGRITQRLFASTVALARKRAVSFDHVHFFWADERCLPPTDSESNFRLADDLLFQPLRIQSKQIHRIEGETSPAAAARSAQETICRTVPQQNAQPVLDLIFLGLGEDGHVASLFPGEPEAMTADSAVYRAVLNSPKPPPERVTLGYGAIAAAQRVWMLASGQAKEGALRESLKSGGKTPFARVLRMRSSTDLFTDIPGF
jgi:6-phosphogluconolactonase